VEKTLLILVVFPFFLFAGELSVQGGVNHSWLYYPDEFIRQIAKNNFNPDVSFSLNALVVSKRGFSGTCGIRFFSVGRFEKSQIENKEVKIKHTYLSFPIRPHYEIFSKFRIYINIEPAFQIRSWYRYEVENSSIQEEEIITDQMNRFNLFSGVGLKYLFRIGKRELGIGGQLDYGLFRISKDELFDVTPELSRGLGRLESQGDPDNSRVFISYLV